MLVTTDQLFTRQPLKLFRVDDDICRVGATGKLAATGTVAVLENKLGARKLVADGITQATAPGFFTHFLLQCLAAVQKIQSLKSLILQISGAITKNIDFRSVSRSLVFSKSGSLTANLPLFTVR